MKILKWTVVVAAMLASVGCGKLPESTVDASAPAAEASMQQYTAVLGSELKDVEPILKQCAQSADASLKIEYTGSLDAVDQVSMRDDIDFVWLSHGKYIQLNPDTSGKILDSEKIMYSRVVMAVHNAALTRLNWVSGKTSWKEVLSAIDKDQFTFAMTNPAGSNSGFVTLIGVSSALSGKSEALSVSDIPQDALKRFFKGQGLSAGSSGTLVAKFDADPQAVDAIINYEANLRMLKRAKDMSIFIPKEGVITADYPFMATSPNGKKVFRTIVNCLRNEAVQKQLAATGRSPVKGEVQVDEAETNELPFPGNVKVIDALLHGFMNQYARPSSTFFVLDVSASMQGERMQSMKEALLGLTRDDGTVTGRFSQFRNNEYLYLLPFSGKVGVPKSWQMTDSDAKNKEILRDITQTVRELDVDSGTAIYSGLEAAYPEAVAAKAKERGPVSILLLTDGENNKGATFEEFMSFIDNQKVKVSVNVIIYGEANVNEMTKLAEKTGGTVFDARKMTLKQVMRMVRNFQ